MRATPVGGWHWAEWLAEFAGTALLLLVAVTTKYWTVRAGVSALEVRITIVAVAIGAVCVAIAFSPLGRRSGAQLNPAVTFGLWLQRTVSTADLVGYSIAQVGGAVGGVAIARVWGVGVTGGEVDWAAIAPGDGVSTLVAAAIEAGGTAAICLGVYAALANERFVRFAAIIGGTALALLIIALAQVSGAGFNPARGLAPDVLAGSYPAVWIFLAPPFLGAAAAAAVVLARGRLPLTGKLRHDPSVPCFMRCELPHTVESIEEEVRDDPGLASLV